MYKNRWVKFTTNSSKELRDNFDDENGARCTSSVVFKKTTTAGLGRKDVFCLFE